MASNDTLTDSSDQPKPAKRQRRVGFPADVGVDPNSCISFRLVTMAKEMEQGPTTVPEFPPEFAERFFGEEGKIYGYKDLKIIIWLHAFSFHAHVEISHSGVVQNANGSKHKVTDLQKVFKEIFGEGLIEDRNKFIDMVPSNNKLSDLVHGNGKRLASLKATDGSNKSWVEVKQDDINVTKEILLVEDLTSDETRDWHSRLTPIVLMFIEAAMPIERKDPRWEVYVCLEKASHEPQSSWIIAGFCTVYRFFKYPDSTRLRVSQILVLPPYQHKSNGLHLLQAVYKTAIERGCYEVTMEEPSNDLQVLRESMDVLRLLSFEPVRSDVRHLLLKLRRNREMLSSSINVQEWLPSPSLVDKVRQDLKICKLQFQYCWQVLVYLHVMNGGEDDLSMFRNLISSFVRIEVFGNPKSSKVGNNKKIVDVENDFDSSRSFIMFKVKPSKDDQGKECTEPGTDNLKAAVDLDPESKVETEYQELLKEREEELHQVAEKVLQHLDTSGTSLIEI